MPMKMGIHCKPIGHRHSASLDSRVRGNDGGMFFPRKRLILWNPFDVGISKYHWTSLSSITGGTHVPYTSSICKRYKLA